MTRRILAFAALAAVLAALFVRLGFWQLDRLRARQARNAALTTRLAELEAPFEQLPDSAAFRRARLSGTPDYEREVVLTGRSHNGSPGVYILTPVRRAGSDTAVIVIRGWVYAPDAASADLSRWREARTDFRGYVLAIPPGQPARASGERKLRTLTVGGVRELFSYPVAPLYLVSQDSMSVSTPARLPMPALDNGPHLSYAVQWFSFAAIAIVGAAIVVFRARNAGSTAA
ncbi:MAG TPA: SURF1 family protein [Gemmatimonadaceae bacterium]|nr:SURF1 family protein [Gemmatimonadaceae bacterium]